MPALDRVRALVYLTALLAAFQSHSAAAQPAPITLSQAVKIALETNPLRKAALADTKVGSSDVRAAQSFLLPHLTFSEGATRGNDPVYEFGSKLRQQRFTTSDFALNRLNTPLPFGNFTTRFGGTWNLFDSFASWRGLNRAKLMEQAASHELNRTEQEIISRVIGAYYGVLLAAKQLDVSQQALQTAQSVLDSSQTKFDAGLAVESDLLTAKVRMAARQQEFVRASNNLQLAQAQLSTAMGLTADTMHQPSEVLAEKALPTPVLAGVEKEAVANRPDLKRLHAQRAAQSQSVAIAKSSFGPRVNAFAGWELDNPTFLAGGGGNNWLGGIEVQFDLFQGGAKKAELSRQQALQEKVIAMKQAADDAVRLDVRQAFYDLDSARQEIDLTRATIAQAQESLRISQNRYDGGLITLTELLSAEDAAHRSQIDYWQSVYRYHTSYANLELATGTLNAQSLVVIP